MTFRVLSFDFDGCLFHLDYILAQGKAKNVIDFNKTFLENIKKENAEFTQVFTFVGSNRQSKATDEANWEFRGLYKGSCFPAIRQVSDYLGTSLDTFLLADIFGDLPPGTSYERAINDKDHSGVHSDWKFDETKVTLIYAQMHKIATENPYEPFVFDFYDDRTNILDGLERFYSEYAYLIPAQVTLRLHRYDGKAVTHKAQIKGVGMIDEHFQQTVKDLTEQAVAMSSDGIKGTLRVADLARPERLENRKALTVVAAEEQKRPDSSFVGMPSCSRPATPFLEEVAKNKFYKALGKIAKKATKLRNKGLEILNRDSNNNLLGMSYLNAAHSATQLHIALSYAAETYFQDFNKPAFNQAANDAIQTALNSALRDHRGYLKQILGYAGLAVLAVLTVATAGIAYAVAGGINYALNRQFFFTSKINTESMNRVLDLQEASLELSRPD